MLIALVVQVHIAALLDLSYLGLCRHSPEMALRYAEELLGLGEMERVPEERSALLMGHMYAAEALCILNRPAEAAEHVSPTTVGDLMNLANAPPPPKKTAAGEEEEEGPGMGVEHPLHYYCSETGSPDPAQARCHLYVNMASVFVTQGELAKAEKCCQQAILAAPGDPHALRLHVYLELRSGQAQGVANAAHALKVFRASPELLQADVQARAALG